MRKQRQVWRYLILIFVPFWLLFAFILIIGDIPFYVISLALTTTAALSALVVALAWAYQNNI